MSSEKISLNHGPFTDYNQFYKVYKIRQGRRGKLRQIEEPIPELMHYQKYALDKIEKIPELQPHSTATAVKGKSILDNANVHEDCKYILRIDLKSCYQTINKFHIVEADYCSLLLSKAICLDALLYRDKNNNKILPTGAPTSPFLCNLALRPLDIELNNLAEKYGYAYTRYIDDMHFSTKNSQRYWGLLNEATQIIESHKLIVNKKKSKWFTNDGSDFIVVTGVRICQEKKVPRPLRRKVRTMLFQHAAKQKPLSKELQGYMAHIYSIDPNTHESMMQKYLTLHESFKQ